MTFYIMFFILAQLACEEPIVPASGSDCNPNPCAENACDPELCSYDTTSMNEEPSDSIMYSMEVLWKTDLPSYGYWHNYIVTDQFIFTNLSEADGYQISCLSKETGELLWTFSDPIVDRFSDLHFHEATQTLIAQRSKRIIALSGGPGQLLSTSSPSNYNSSATYGALLGDFYYLPVRSSDSQKGFILRSHVSDLTQWEEIYEVHTDDVDGSRPSMNSMNIWNHPVTNDEILVFQHRMSFPRRVDLLAYNLTADTILWWHKDVDPAGNSNIQQIDIFNGKAIFFGSSSLHCVDIATGNILWNKIHPAPPETPSKSFMFSKAELYDNHALWIAYGDYYTSSINDYSNNIMVVDIQTGQLLFEIEDAQPNKLIATENSVFNNSNILVFDGGSKQAILTEEEHPGFKIKQFDLEEDHKILYCTISVNGKQEAYVYALKIPEGWL